MSPLREPLLKVFPATLLGRIQTIPYYPLSNIMLTQIVKLQLDRVVKRIYLNHEIELYYNENVLNLILNRCTELESGGRMIDAIITNTILPELSLEILSRMGTEQKMKSIVISVNEAEFEYQYI